MCVCGWVGEWMCGGGGQVETVRSASPMFWGSFDLSPHEATIPSSRPADDSDPFFTSCPSDDRQQKGVRGCRLQSVRGVTSVSHRCSASVVPRVGTAKRSSLQNDWYTPWKCNTQLAWIVT